MPSGSFAIANTNMSSVGGYPEGHPDAPNKDQCTQYLKRKIDAGADFVVTQLFFDLDEYKGFLERCDRNKINCPIVPGVMPIVSYDRFARFADFSKTKVPPQIMQKLQAVRSNDEKVRELGVELCIDMSKELIKLGAPGLHYYTLNLESSVSEALQALNLLDDCRSRRPFDLNQYYLQSQDIHPTAKTRAGLAPSLLFQNA